MEVVSTEVASPVEEKQPEVRTSPEAEVPTPEVKEDWEASGDDDDDVKDAWDVESEPEEEKPEGWKNITPIFFCQ